MASAVTEDDDSTVGTEVAQPEATESGSADAPETVENPLEGLEPEPRPDDVDESEAELVTPTDPDELTTEVPRTRGGRATDSNRIVGELLAVGGSAVLSDHAVTSVSWVSDRQAVRTAGDNRYETAAALSAHAFPDGAESVWLVTGQDHPDGLTASAVAASANSPVLLTQTSILTPAAAEELGRLDPRDVWVVGGPGAVKPGVLDEVQNLLPGATIHRVGGAERYETAARLSAALVPSSDVAFVAIGTNFPDALSAGPAAAQFGAPTLLVRGGSIPAATQQELRRLAPSTVYVVGGPGVIPNAMLSSIRSITKGQVVRVSGDDRYKTAAAVADRFFEPTTARVVLATGENFPDSMTAGAVAGASNSPLLLATSQNSAPSVTVDAARRVSWYLPDDGRVLRYIAVTHPDDEFAVWSTAGVTDPRRYDVFILLTTGESTARCNGQYVNTRWMNEQYLPQPQPTGQQFTERCKKHRIDSWNTFMDRAGAPPVGGYTRVELGPADFFGQELPVALTRDETSQVVPAGYVDVAIGPDSARLVFDMGALTTDEILWAIQSTRDMRDLFPTQLESDIIGAGYYNVAATGIVNTQMDHVVLNQVLSTVDLQLPGSQYQSVGHRQTGRAFGATAADYCSFMCHPAASAPFNQGMGHFQYAYGWLSNGLWPPGAIDQQAGFSEYQSYSKWF
ncbi:MAG: cell wall-binding repeat-containing protein [Brooklawnia sp.]